MQLADVIDDAALADGAASDNEDDGTRHRIFPRDSGDQLAERRDQARVLFAALRGHANVEAIHADFVGAVADVHAVVVQQTRLQFGGRDAGGDLEEHEIGAGRIDVEARDCAQGAVQPATSPIKRLRP